MHFIGGSSTVVHAVNKPAKRHQRYDKGRRQESTKAPITTTPSQPPPFPCRKCGQMHWHSDCKVQSLPFCKSCNKTGHRTSACYRRKTTHVSNAIFIAHTSAEKQNRIYTNVQINGKSIKMQLDTGAEATLLNVKDWERLNKPQLSPTTINLRTATNAQIKVKGQFNCNFVLNGHHGSGHCHVTDTATLLGMDWIAQDSQLYKLLQGSINTVMKVAPEASTACRQTLETSLRASFPAVFEAGLGRCTKARATLHLKENASPAFRKARPVAYAVLPKVAHEVKRLVDQGVYTATDYSDFAAPVVVVDKKDGTIRLCGDYSTGLNDALETHQHPLPTAEDIFTTLNGGKYFTQIDLAEAYLQIEVEEQCKKLLTINTHLGLFYPNRLPFGVKTAPAIFQQIIDTMISGLEGVAAYMDDLVICGSTIEEHNARLHKLFKRIEEFGLRVKPAKCSFLQPEIKFLGFIISQHGRRPGPAKIAAIDQMPAPTDISQLRSFLGMVQFYGSFVKDLQNFRGPLDTLTKKDVIFQWTKNCQSAFDNIKSVLKSQLLLTHYDPRLPIIVAADASNYGIGAVITHRFPDGSEKAIFHASRTLTAAQKGYSQIEKEALGLIFAVQKFHRYIHGRKFTLRTDHKPLVAIFGSKKGIPIYSSSRLQRWAIILLNYDFNIEYINTASFGQADALSRLIASNAQSLETEERVIAHVEAEVNAEHRGIVEALPVNSTAIRRATMSDRQTSAVMNTKLRLLSVDGQGHRANRPHCTDCQAAAKNPVKTTLEPWPATSSPFERVHIDYAGPINDTYYLVVIDAYSKWPEILPTKSITTTATITLLNPIFARYGNPRTLVSDNGTQFTSSEFTKFCTSRGIRHLRSPPFHPQSNGQAERFVDTFKRALRKLRRERTTQDALQTFLMSYRSTPCTSSPNQLSPAENFIGRKMYTVLDLMIPTHPGAQPENTTALEKMKNQFNRHHGARMKVFAPGDSVFVKDFRSKAAWTPGRVIARFGKVKYRVECNGQQWDRHANQLRRRDHQPQAFTSSTLLDFFELPSPAAQISPPSTLLSSLPILPAPQSSTPNAPASSSVVIRHLHLRRLLNHQWLVVAALPWYRLPLQETLVNHFSAGPHGAQGCQLG
uniref:Reverse transcriptase n=1 Tax=Caenorhabditis japonica TaxID=281687 RepID=A0A8R1IV69_CAEJA